MSQIKAEADGMERKECSQATIVTIVAEMIDIAMDSRRQGRW